MGCFQHGGSKRHRRALEPAAVQVWRMQCGGPLALDVLQVRYFPLGTHPARSSLSPPTHRQPFPPDTRSCSTRACGQTHIFYGGCQRWPRKLFEAHMSTKAAGVARRSMQHASVHRSEYACPYVRALCAARARLECRPWPGSHSSMLLCCCYVATKMHPGKSASRTFFVRVERRTPSIH